MVYSVCGGGLGDCWASVNYMLGMSEAIRDSVYLSDHYDHNRKRKEVGSKLKEILPLFSSIGKVIVTGEDSGVDCCLSWLDVYPVPYLPTKVRWVTNKSKTVCYQFDKKSHMSGRIPKEDEQLVLDTLCEMGFVPVKLGREQTIEEAVALLAACEFFVGLDSGFTHVAHSVGVPVYMIRSERPMVDIQTIYRYKEYILCHTAADCIQSLRERGSDNVL